ncbi:MAG: hypothetical protein SOT80_03425, partial [Candidatus Pseudoruminococcus sp.]|nr:hypothetical protein [Candidatus Pseudoruminococcus sp.]
LSFKSVLAALNEAALRFKASPIPAESIGILFAHVVTLFYFSQNKKGIGHFCLSLTFHIYLIIS